MNAAPQLYLLDGSSYIYRAYYGVRDLATSGGMPTNAVFGFTRMLLGLLQENRPDYLAVVLDPPREETFRRELYPPYKAHRDAMPADLALQLPYIRRILQALTIPALEAPGFEADDVIATLARRHAAEGGPGNGRHRRQGPAADCGRRGRPPGYHEGSALRAARGHGALRRPA